MIIRDQKQGQFICVPPANQDRLDLECNGQVRTESGGKKFSVLLCRMEIKGEWKDFSAGGGIDGPCWRNNNQYILSDLKDGEECTISLKVLEKKLSSNSKEREGVGFALFKSFEGSFSKTVNFSFTKTNDHSTVVLSFSLLFLTLLFRETCHGCYGRW